MKVGFIGFGMVSANLTRDLMKNGCEVISSSQGRSEKTSNLINDCGVEDLESFEKVAMESDILISANSPANALNVAEKYGVLAKDIFIDLNNITPNISFSIETILGNKFVDGAIIGNVSSDKSIIYVAGEMAEKSIVLNGFGLKVKVISEKIGDASMIKTLRSIYTKGVSAILIDLDQTAKELNLEEELFETLSITEGENFSDSAKSRIENSLNNPQRKYEEMNEIFKFLNKFNNENNTDLDIKIIEAIKNKFKDLTEE
ncbi:MAG: NAD(P)-binding domain-containing protein [Methanobrevibacter sp.]|jgi:3-hydroxyisobutyrate dehydrogenase-like beta-hydroxyacid dehydrogenase|nr:NAD(P)-binding domain-containing protein [Methanobrevibacter sp.]